MKKGTLLITLFITLALLASCARATTAPPADNTSAPPAGQATAGQTTPGGGLANALLTVEDAQGEISQFCEYYQVTYQPTLNKDVAGISYYGFHVDFSESFSTGTGDNYCYAFVNSITGDVVYEESGYAAPEPAVYTNLPDELFPVPDAAYDMFTPPEYVWGVAYYYNDKSVMQTYQAQLLAVGFEDLGEVQSVESLWQYTSEEDGTIYSVEMYSQGERFSMNMYINYA
ncbi:MAG: hypothetical protein FWD16_05990 [Clostridia bacterium]|nr:hypothetical protein [Clostridia bacterium]